MDLFKTDLTPDKLHPNFKNTLLPHAQEIRKVLEEWAKGFVDRDGKFVTEFQTTYNSAFWELYLYAVLKELRLGVDFSFNAPDFVINNRNLLIEATIASHAHDDTPEWEKTISGINAENSFKVFEYSTIRLANAFMGKINKYRNQYSKLPHVKGKPL